MTRGMCLSVRCGQGAEIRFALHAGEGAPLAAAGPEPPSLTVFTTRPDTLFGVTYVCVAPEHPLVSQLVRPGAGRAGSGRPHAGQRPCTCMGRRDGGRGRPSRELPGHLQEPRGLLAAAQATPEQATAVASYVEAAARKSDLERTELAKDKSGVPTGARQGRGAVGGVRPAFTGGAACDEPPAGMRATRP